MIRFIRVHLTAAAIYLPAVTATHWFFAMEPRAMMCMGLIYGCAGMLFALKREEAR